LGLTQNEFIDLCILCGCDYTSNITGMGPITAYKYLTENKNIEGVLRKIKNENMNPKKKK
jgi:flap endonuclease-1